ncbi:nuclear transport factor 2 family protein [Streptomyces sp. NPDC056190]|uniref:nuclear transport factor 2 family protein n=1 Tax=Streptomyces sp. NPDC056190 TaxID=3345741 RepID=UPI0035E28696
MTMTTPTDREAIRSLLIRFAWDADTGTRDDLAGYFTDTSTWLLGDQTWTGTTEIVSGLIGLRDAGHAGPGSGTRHLMSDIDMADEIINGHVSVRSIFVLTSTGERPSLIAVGTYHDRIIRTGTGWRIGDRQVVSL